MNVGTILKSKTFWGAALASVAWVLQQPHVGVMEILQAGGALVSAIGVRDAIANVQKKQ